MPVLAAVTVVRLLVGGSMAAEPAEQENMADKLRISMPALVHNSRFIEGVRGPMSIIAGAATGILGATGLQGFALYLFFYVLTSVGLLVKMRGRVGEYVPLTWYSFLFADIFNHLLSFLLFWTMLYTLVYIY